MSESLLNLDVHTPQLPPNRSTSIAVHAWQNPWGIYHVHVRKPRFQFTIYFMVLGTLIDFVLADRNTPASLCTNNRFG
jgi:hypothetical protein